MSEKPFVIPLPNNKQKLTTLLRKIADEASISSNLDDLRKRAKKLGATQLTIWGNNVKV